jgi:adenylate cyclase
VRYHFENCTLDVRRGCLSVADREVEIPPKGFAMLRYLVESAGRLVTKDEAVVAVWGASAVTDDSLARCISDVRAAIALSWRPRAVCRPSSRPSGRATA